MSNTNKANPEIGNSEKREGKSIKLKNGRELKPWRFENPNNEKEKILNDGTVMKWCTNDCHPRPMWCGRKNCLNRAEYTAKYGARNKEDSTKEERNKKQPMSKDFKIAMAAMTTKEDYESLKGQFFSGND